ncbi:hypothetical protein DRE_05969 [Drechslerella stenobrocha 248]|uniref:Uncharacterized protein n=1 Tax=Drechslerella stenobrocha 248 TaxID=1043628 RepID=W7HYI8_9PEZI|nr:hypothetical protein DRE_05969 [Drechslerella stenobrocha 248]
MSLFSPPSPTNPYNLRKRKADIDQPQPPESPLTKRFKRLNLRGASSSPSSSPSSKVIKRGGNSTRLASTATLPTAVEPWNLTPPPFPRPLSPPPAVMDVDDTPYKIYINDLDSSSDSDEPVDDNPIIFLSDVEREMTRIPMAVLKASYSVPSLPVASVAPTSLPTAKSSSGTSTDLILYRPPAEIADDRSSVRQLILQARERMRARDSSPAATMDGIDSTPVAAAAAVDARMTMTDGQVRPIGGFAGTVESDPDAMVLDDL